MRRPMIAGNWKMHKNLRESIELVTALKRELHSENDRDVAVCPPFTALATVGEILQGAASCSARRTSRTSSRAPSPGR